MSSSLKVPENEIICAIPPVISYNPREKVEPEHISVYEVLKHLCHSRESVEIVNKKVLHSLPIPRYPISIDWSPNAMFFEMDDVSVSQKLRIWNVCSRSICITFCQFWGDTARLGAKWRCFPRTRSVLAPGLTADLLVQATPRAHSLVPSAQIAIQLAAAYKRDCVVAYFVIPITVKFLKYVKPCQEEASNYNSITVS